MQRIDSSSCAVIAGRTHRAPGGCSCDAATAQPHYPLGTDADELQRTQPPTVTNIAIAALPVLTGFIDRPSQVIER